jgi:hypothetical protein
MLQKKLLLIVLMVMLFPGAAFAEEWNDYWVYGWHDEVSGYNVYNLSPGNEKVKEGMELLHNPSSNEWLRLEENVSIIWSYSEYQNFPDARIIVGGKHINPYENYYYDIQNNHLVLGKQYEISPDKKWGIQYNDYSQLTGERNKSFLLKNMKDGSIIEWFKTDNSIWYDWLPDSTFLFCTFSTEEKQNVIYIFNPETKKNNKLVSGSLRAYDRDNNRIIFVKNEPMRKLWVMDLSTRKEVQDDKIASFFITKEMPKIPLPPLDLDLNSLKVISPKRITRYEHEMTIGEKTIPLTYVFEKENKEFIPLRPLMEPLGIKLNITQMDRQNKKYQVSYRENKFTLSKDEFINYKWQIFVTPDALKKLGLGQFNIRALRFEKGATDTWGIQLTAAKATSTGLTLVCNQSGGKPTGDLQTGSPYWLEVSKDNKWVPVELLPSEHKCAWTDEAWIISKNDSTEWEVNWTGLYGELPVGNYRIGKEITDFRGSGDYDKNTYYANFEVVN